MKVINISKPYENKAKEMNEDSDKNYKYNEMMEVFNEFLTDPISEFECIRLIKENRPLEIGKILITLLTCHLIIGKLLNDTDLTNDEKIKTVNMLFEMLGYEECLNEIKNELNEER